MDIYKTFLEAGEPLAAGLYEEPDRGLFYRKALGLRRFYESAPLFDYTGGRLYPSGPLYSKTAVAPHYFHGFSTDKQGLNAIIPDFYDTMREEFFKPNSSVPHEHTVAGNMWLHSMPNYRRIEAEGLESYIPRIERIADTDMREGLLHLISGIGTYCRRIVEYLRSVNAYGQLISALEQVPMKPARNIYEALVCHNFLFYLDTCDNEGCLASDLMPYYNGEDITDLLREFFANVDTTGAYSMSLGVDYNPLTVQCLKAVKGLRRPMVELFINDNCPDEVWDAALESVRTNNGQPAFYNYDKLIGGLGQRFPEIRREDLQRFCGGGCTESMLEGLCNVGSLDAGINLPLILHDTLSKDLTGSGTFEEFYRKFMDNVRDVSHLVMREISASQKRREKNNPLPMRTLLVDDCIDKGLDFNGGGARYMWSIISFAGLTNVIDSMLVIEDLVFTKRTVSAVEMLEKLNSNDEDFIRALRRHPVCHGIDDPRANAMAARVTSDVYSTLDDGKPYLGLGFIPASIMFAAAVMAGKSVGATPDGRLDGDPLAESMGAIYAKDVNGATSLLSSVASMNLRKALGVPVTNLTVNPDFSDTALRGLIKGYMDMGGVHLQISCVSREILEEAYADPEKHKNLVVRVGGYSEYFHRLDDEQKRLVISRMIH